MADGDLRVVLGAGPVGRALAGLLQEQGHAVRAVSRSGSADVASGAEVVQADIADPDDAVRACAGASVVYGCVGLDYTGWPKRWPPMMQGMLAGAAAARARFVFMDNLYMYGPVDEPMHEEMPLTDYGRKPSVRADLTRMWLHAHAAGRVQTASVRASDFYGPGVTQAALGDYSFGRIAQGKSAQMFGDVDLPHSFSYVPDIARALVSVGDAEDAMGQAWNVPTAPDRSVREVLAMFAAALGQDLKVQTMPGFMISALGLVNRNMGEVKEMLYQWQRPFHVDHGKFAARFWDDATPLEQGVAAAAGWYGARAAS